MLFDRDPPPDADPFHDLAWAANRYLRIANPVPLVTYRPPASLTLGFASAGSLSLRTEREAARASAGTTFSGNLFTAIITAMASAITIGGRSLSKCIHCDNLYEARRSDQKYCRTCGDKASWKLSKRRLRAAKSPASPP